MKRITIMMLTAAVLAGLLTGCRNRPMDMEPMTEDTSHATQATHAHTEPATQHQTEKPTQQHTEPGTQDPLMPEDDMTIPDGMIDGTDDATGGTEDTTSDITGKMRRHMPRVR